MANPFDQFDEKPKQNPFEEIDKQAAAQGKQQRVSAMREVAAAEPWWSKLLISTGKGMTDVGRGAANLFGANKQPSEVEQEAWMAMQEEAPITSTIGEIAGQALPFAPLAAGGAAVTAGRTLLPRVFAQGAVGGLEGAAIAKGTGGDAISSAGIGAAIAGGVEAISPVLGRIGGQVYRSVTGRSPKGTLVTPQGAPTPEMEQALQRAGLKWDDLILQAKQAVANQPQGASPEQVARIAGFEQMQTPYSRGNITQADVDVGAEQRLLGSIVDPKAEQYRSLVTQQSTGFENEVNRIADSFGSSRNAEEVGKVVKDALINRKRMLKADRKQAYGRLAEASRNAGDLPILATDLMSKISPDLNPRRIRSIAPGQYDAMQDLLVEFGVVTDQAAIDEVLKRGLKPEDIKPLTLSNFEVFRQELTQIASTDRTGAISNMTGPIKQALDEEIDLMSRTMELSPAPEVAQAAKDARRSHVALMTEFDPKAITTKLTDRAAWGSNEPKVYASKVYQQVMAKNTPIEQVEALVSSLGKSGSTGKLALNEMRGQMALDLMDSAMKAQTNKINGQLLFNGNAFVKAFTDNETKIRALYKDDPAALKRLENVVARAKDITPSARMTPKGSADQNMDIARSMFGLLGLADSGVTSIGAGMASGFFGGRAISKSSAKAATPQAQRTIYLNQMISENYPRLAAGLAVSATAAEKEENNPQ